MRTICFYFQVHQPFRLKKNYRFFDIGKDHYYYDDFANKSYMRKAAERCYLPMNQVLLDLIEEHGSQFKVTFSLSGTVIDQMEMYAPEVLESFKKLAATGNVEFLAETYSHSLSSLKNKDEFFAQVKAHDEKILQHFNQKPKVFRNTELIYTDLIGEQVAEMGYKAMLTEGAKHVLGWKSPNYLYYNANNPKLKVLLKNFLLSDDIAFRFSNQSWEQWPLTADKFVHWLNIIDKREEVVNLFMDYETFGEHQWKETGIFQFMRALPGAVLSHTDFNFMTASEVAEKLQPVAAVHVPYPISWADEERDLTAWLGNELQREAYNKLYDLAQRITLVNDPKLQRDWKYLQTSDHFYYMCTKFFADGDVHKYFNPYNNPYDAFINFMNVFSDFSIRIEKEIEKQNREEKLIYEEEHAADLINQYEERLKELKSKMKDKVKKSKDSDESEETVEVKPKAKSKKTKKEE